MSLGPTIPLFSEKTPLMGAQPLLEEDETKHAADTQSSTKLGTFLGVFVPTCNGICGVVIFRRWGFAVGQAGLGGSILMILLGTVIALCTATSLSAIVTNGKSRGGGAYYYISRTLGPEFGGSIGLQYYLSQSAFVGFVCLGLAEAILETFDVYITDGNSWDTFIIASCVLLFTLCVACMGTVVFARMSVYVFSGIITAVIVGLCSLWFRSETAIGGCSDNAFVGPSIQNLRDNWGSGYNCDSVENCPPNIGWLPIFAVVYASMAGFLSGSNMSGDLKKPAESIPHGTFLAVATTSTIYFLISFSLALSLDRRCLRENYQVFQDACIQEYIVFVGTVCSTFSSSLGGLIGTAKVLQAMALDNYLPRFEYFARLSKRGEPIHAYIATWFIAQMTLFLGDINTVAPYITSFMLLTFMTINFSCFILDVTGMPNFRPTYHYYSWPIALFGALSCLACMFAINDIKAIISLLAMVVVFVAISYTKPQHSWGDITQPLIYRQVRKFLLMLDIRKEHVKYWRPQVLLLLSSAGGDSKNMASICNDMKKGGLFVIGHIIKGDLLNVAERIPSIQNDWLTKIDPWKTKSFVQLAVAPSLSFGAQNMALITGLGSMRPNTVAFGFYGRNVRSNAVDVTSDTDFQDYVNCLRHVHALNKNIILLRGFSQFDRKRIEMHIPPKFKPRFDMKKHGPRAGMTIDVWFLETGSSYLSEAQVTVAIQLVHILHSSDFWVKNTRVRVLYLTQHDQTERHEYYERLLDMTRTFADLVPVPIFEPKKYTTAFVQAGVKAASIEALSERELQAYFLSLPLLQRHSIMNHIIQQHTDHTAIVYVALSIDRDIFTSRTHGNVEKERGFFHRLRTLTHDLPPAILVFPSQQSVTTDEL